MHKKKLVLLLLVLLTALIFVVADYMALFGLSEKSDFVVKEVKLRPVDARDGAPIIGTRIRCFQDRNRNACTQKESGKLGIVSMMIPSTKISKQTLFFKKGFRYEGSADPNIQVMLIHLDYQNFVTTIDVAEALNGVTSAHKVVMEPRWLEEPEEADAS